MLGCGGAYVGGGTVNGALLGKTFAPIDAVSRPLDSNPLVTLTSFAGACSFATTYPDATKSNSSVLTFFFIPQNTTIGTGATIQAPANVDVQFATYDGSCNNAGSLDQGATGTITLTRFNGTGIDGTFDLTMGGSGEHITGSFTAPTCSSTSTDASVTQDGGVAGCK